MYCNEGLNKRPSKQSAGDAWTHRRAARRKHVLWEVVDGFRDPIATVYTGEADARLLAASKGLLSACGALLAILHHHAREGHVSARELDRINAIARATQSLTTVARGIGAARAEAAEG